MSYFAFVMVFLVGFAFSNFAMTIWGVRSLLARAYERGYRRGLADAGANRTSSKPSKPAQPASQQETVVAGPPPLRPQPRPIERKVHEANVVEPWRPVPSEIDMLFAEISNELRARRIMNEENAAFV